MPPPPPWQGLIREFSLESNIYLSGKKKILKMVKKKVQSLAVDYYDCFEARVKLQWQIMQN